MAKHNTKKTTGSQSSSKSKGKGKAKTVFKKKNQQQAPPQIGAGGLTQPTNAPTLKSGGGVRSASSTVRQNFSRYQVRIPVSEREDQVYLQKTLGLAHFVNTFEEEHGGQGKHPHPIGAALREISTAFIMNYAYSKGKRNLLSVYGSPRDARIGRFLNHKVKGKHQLNIQIHRSLDTTCDYKRVIVEGVEDWGLYDAAFLVDIYQTGKEHFLALIDSLFYQNGEVNLDLKVYWTGFRFRGMFGTEGEAAWIRSNGKIKYSPDETTMYPEHDPLDFLWDIPCIDVGNQEQRYLHWTTIKEWPGSSRVVIQFSMSADKPIASYAPDPTAMGRKVRVRAPRNGGPLSIGLRALEFAETYGGLSIFRNFARRTRDWLTPTELKEFTVHQDYFLKTKAKLRGRKISSYMFQSMAVSLQRSFEQDREVSRLVSMFPKETSEVLRDTIHAALLDDIHRDQDFFKNTNRFYGSAIEERNAALLALGSKEPDVTSTIIQYTLLVGISIFTIYKIRKMFQPSTSASSRTALMADPQLLSDTINCVKKIVPRVDVIQTRSVSVLNNLIGIVDRIGDVVLRQFQRLSSNYLGGLQCYPPHYLKQSLIYCPIVEELWKFSTGFYGTAFFIVAEMLHKILAFPGHIHNGDFTVNQLPTAFLGVGIAAGMHCCLYNYVGNSFYRVPIAMGLHSFYNLVVASTFDKAFTKTTQAALGITLTCGLVAIAAYLGVSCSRSLRSRWSVFKERYYSEEWPKPALLGSGVHVSSFPESEVWVPANERAHWPTPPVCESLRSVGLVQDIGTRSWNSTTMYIPTDLPLYRPAQSYYCMDVALRCRIIKQPPLHPKQQEIVWRRVKDIFPEHSPIIYEEHLDDWLLNFNDTERRRRRILQAVEDFTNYGLPDQVTIKLFVKANEVLTWRENGLKPRTISNIPSIFQAAVGPYIHAATIKMKEYFNQELNPLNLTRGKLFVRYCSSANDHQLTIWREEFMRVMQTHDFSTMVAGDDSMMWYLSKFGMLEFEWDVSAFDQSQSFGPLKYEHRQLRLLGVPKEATDTLLRLSKAPCKTKWRTKIYRSDRPMRDSGGADTTLGNGIIMITAILQVCEAISKMPPSISPFELGDVMREEFLKLGFKVTGGRLPLGSGSFLKGLWYPTQEHGLVWGPTPSRIVKTGKAYEDPRTTMRSKGEQRLTLRQGCQRHAESVANTYASFLQVPILRAYVSRFKTGGHGAKRPYKISASGRYARTALDLNETIALLHSRYALTVKDVNDLENIYGRVELFSFIEHPAFRKLSIVDYGE